MTQPTHESNKRPISPALAAWLLPAMAMSGMFKGRSAYAERHDPNRPKTKSDLEAIAAAEEKRRKKAMKKSGRGTDSTDT